MVEPKARPGVGFERADLGDHVGEILVADAADPAQRRQIALGEQIKPADQRLHRGIEAVALAQLDRRALGEIARATPGGSKLCTTLSTASTSAIGAPSFSDTESRSPGEVAGLVDHIDQELADPMRRTGSMIASASCSAR